MEKKHLGRVADLPNKIESQLAQHILNMESRFYGHRFIDVRKLAF